MSTDQPSSGQGQQWWLSKQGTPRGPYDVPFILDGLLTGNIPAQTHACPVGGQTWKRLSEWPVFATAFPPPPPPGTSQLPTMANWICIYGIILSPILYAMSTLATLVGWAASDGGGTVVLDLLSMAIGVGSTVLLVMGGLRLKAFRFSALVLLKTGLWISLISTAVLLFLYMVIGAAEGASGMATTSPSDAETAIFVILLPLALASVVFEIVALVWLTKHEKELPLRRDS